MTYYFKVAIPVRFSGYCNVDSFGKRFFYSFDPLSGAIVKHNTVTIFETKFRCTKDSLETLLKNITPKSKGNQYAQSTKNPTKNIHLDNRQSVPDLQYLTRDLNFPKTINGFTLEAVGVNVNSNIFNSPDCNLVIIYRDKSNNVPVNGHSMPNEIEINFHVELIPDNDCQSRKRKGGGYKPLALMPPSASAQLREKATVFKQNMKNINFLLSLDFHDPDLKKHGLVLTEGTDPLNRFNGYKIGCP